MSQELPGHEVRAEELQRHYGIVRKALTLRASIQGRYENDRQCVRHRLVADDHRELQLGPTSHFQMRHLNQVRPNQR